MDVHIDELPHDVLVKVLLIACTSAVQDGDAAMLQVSTTKQQAKAKPAFARVMSLLDVSARCARLGARPSRPRA
jgi:hypothetical protein